MGCSNYSSDVYKSIASKHSTKSRDDIFANDKIDKDMNPKDLVVRECRDSTNHPEALPIIIGLDETGSMGSIPEQLCKGKLGTLIETMIDHKIKDPAVLFLGIGDHHSDRAPLQVGQFESGAVELNKWLTSVYLEGNGGGQNMESYLLAWFIAGRHTVTDHFEKRRRKGYLFTIGDEWTWDNIDSKTIENLMGCKAVETVIAEQLLSEAKRLYEVFHIHINSTGYRDDKSVIGPWRKLLGERLLILDDPEIVAELIASTIGVMEGANIKAITDGFDKDTAKKVKNALTAIKPNSAVTGTSGIEKL
jgi:hypothetical protein